MPTDIEKQLDRTGRRILYALQENARISFSDLGRKVGLTAPAVAERVRRMEASGLIAGYHAALDAQQLGLPVQAFIRLCTPAEKYPRVLAVLEDLPEVLECCHVTGEDAFVLRVVAASMPHLERIIARLSPFGETATSLIMSSPIQRRLLRDIP